MVGIKKNFGLVLTKGDSILLNCMNTKYSKNIRANYLDARDGDIKESVCDNSKIIKILKIESFKNFKEEIIKL